MYLNPLYNSILINNKDYFLSSIMAGFAMMGINYEEGGTGVYNVSFISEYRGHSYAVGGDKGAQTLATFIENYSPDVKGASVLSHFTSYCTANNCNFPDNACK